MRERANCLGPPLVDLERDEPARLEQRCRACQQGTRGVQPVGAADQGLAWLELAYRRRTLVATAIGATVLGLAISGMHYTAMLFTTFTAPSEVAFIAMPALSTSV